MSAPLLTTDRLVKRFGGLLATDNVSIDVRDGEIHALIGPNGAGKTTLVGQLTGNLPPDSGTIHFAGREVATWGRPLLLGNLALETTLDQ